jgi:hypothetical protein
MSKFFSVVIGLSAAALLIGCNSTVKPGALPPMVSINAPVVKPVLDDNGEGAFYQCRDEVLAMDRSAAKNASLAQYLAAANASGGCLLLVQGSHSFVIQQQLMQLQALAVLDYLKGGDVFNARDTLAEFKRMFSGRDLYFADHSSFIDTFDLLLNQSEAAAGLVGLNVNKTLLAEFERQHYWVNH